MRKKLFCSNIIEIQQFLWMIIKWESFSHRITWNVATFIVTVEIEFFTAQRSPTYRRETATTNAADRNDNVCANGISFQNIDSEVNQTKAKKKGMKYGKKWTALKNREISWYTLTDMDYVQQNFSMHFFLNQFISSSWSESIVWMGIWTV